MLDKEKVKSSIEGLTDEQVDMFLKLHKIDVDESTEAHWTRIDEDLKALTGNDKPGGKKTHEWFKIAFNEMKSKADKSGDNKALKKENEGLKTKVTDLEDKIAKGTGDAALKTKVEDLEKKLKDTSDALTLAKSQFDTEKKDLQSKLDASVKDNSLYQINSSIDGYIAKEGIKFKKGIDKDILKEILNKRRSDFVESLHPDIIEHEGKKTQVFRKEPNGEIIRDKSLNPITAGQLYVEKSISDLIDKGVQKKGGGTGSGGGSGYSDSLDLTGVKTKPGAIEAIDKYLMKTEGLTKLDDKFQVRRNKIIQEHNVLELPMTEEG